MLRISGWARSWAYDLWIGLKPFRFGLLTVLLLAVLLMEPWIGQGRDVLLEYATFAFSDTDVRRRICLYLATFSLAMLTWFFCRLSGHLRFAAEKDVLRRYRKEFPRQPFNWSEPSQKTAIADDAVARVGKIRKTREWAPRVLGILIPLVVAVSIWLAAGRDAWIDVLILIALAVLVGAVVIPRRYIQNLLAEWFAKKKQPRISGWLLAGEVTDTVATWSKLGRVTLALIAIVLAFVAISVIFAAIIPLKFGQFFGPVPVTMLVLTVVVMVGSLMAMFSRVSNFPWFTFIVGLWVMWNFTFGSHGMRFVDDPDKAIAKRMRPSELASAFVKKLQGSEPKVAILVATAGGGSRAAYWTATVLGELNRLKPDKFNKHLLLISGVSGGSIGTLFSRASTLAAPDTPKDALAIAQGGASGDFLSATLSSMFMGELIPGRPDRAEVMERAWSASFDKACRDALQCICPVDLEQGFLQLWPEDRHPWPALILNGTVVESGGRAVASSLALHCEEGDQSCALVDVADLLAYGDRDLRASTAANVSARFPIVGPSARVRINAKGEEKSVVDGGYFDNFGATTLIQVMREMSEVFKRENIVPVVIQITSDPDFRFPPEGLSGRLELRGEKPGGLQLLEPLEAFQNLRSSHGRQTMLELKTLVETELDGAYVHFDQCWKDVGGGGAPLAWVISRGSQKLLNQNAESSSEDCDNAASFKQVANCLSSPDTCKSRP